MDGEMEPTALEAALESETEPLVVDIRSPQQFQREHIPGSLNLPLARLPREIERVADAEVVVTVCPHGKASIQAANLIASFEGFDGSVYSLASGLEGWDGDLSTAGEATGYASESPDAPF